MHRNACVAWLFATACTIGAPPGFSSGDHWTLPLVGPLEDGLLVTPVTVGGRGPYLFAIDPDANLTAVDQDLVKEVELQIVVGPRRIDETDTGQSRSYVELIDLKVGNLAIDRRSAMVFPSGFYDTEGRKLRGVLGRDVIPDSLVFGFDRDQGVAMLSTTKSFSPPPGAIAIRYETLTQDATGAASNAAPGRGGMTSGAIIAPVQRRLASARIGDATLAMHLDLGAALSQLRESTWQAARLSRVPAKLHVTDEVGSARDTTAAGVAAEVVVGSARASGTTFVPYIEKRFVVESVDGALGLDFFQPYAVHANWDKATYYLAPRGDVAATLTARLGRWGTALPACPHPGCVTAELVTTAGSVVLNVARDAEAASHGLEVLLHVTPVPGKSAVHLLVELPVAARTLTGALPSSYAGATLAVADVSPFPRQCVDPSGCILPLGVIAAAPDDAPPTPEAVPAQEAAPAQDAPPPAAATPATRTVAPARLRRVTGAAIILPDSDVKRTTAGQSLATAIIRLCLTAEGKVDFTKLVKSSGAAAYDSQIQDTIKSTWSFEPVEIDGKPQPVCTTLTFKPS